MSLDQRPVGLDHAKGARVAGRPRRAAERPDAVAPDYSKRLAAFLRARRSHLSCLMT